MTANTRLAIVNHWDEGTLTASSAVSTLPVENTRLHSRGSPWRSTTNAAQWLQRSHTVDRAANMVAFFGHNLAGGTARLRLYSDAAATTQVYDSTALAIPAQASATAAANYGLGGNAGSPQAADDLFGNSQPYVLYFAATVFRAAKLDLVGGALATSYLQVGRIWLPMYREIGANPDYGLGNARWSNTQQTRTRGGSLISNTGATARRLDLNVKTVADSEADFWDDVLRYSELAKDVFVSIFPDAGGRLQRDYAINGKFVALDPRVYDVTWRAQHLVIEEL